MLRARTVSLEFLLPSSLPIIGEMHPLRRRYVRRLYFAGMIAAVCHLAAFTGFLIHRGAEMASIPGTEVVINTLPPPPSIVDRPQPAMEIPVVVSAAAVGVPEPVTDFLAPEQTILDNAEISGMFDKDAILPMDGIHGNHIVVELPKDTPEDHPAPGTFVAVEEAPELISLPAPIYPDMARQAEIEGTVLVQVLIGKDGRVKDARAGADLPMLRDSALAAARLAVFKPALQQHRPVEVWVVIPMRFVLH